MMILGAVRFGLVNSKSVMISVLVKVQTSIFIYIDTDNKNF